MSHIEVTKKIQERKRGRRDRCECHKANKAKLRRLAGERVRGYNKVPNYGLALALVVRTNVTFVKSKSGMRGGGCKPVM